MRSTVKVVPTPTVGAEVQGLDYENISEDDKRALYAAWLEYGVLIFKEAGRSTRIHMELSRVFGPLEKHPVISLRVAEEPDLIYLGGEGTNKGPAIMVNGESLAGFIYYHQDTSYTPSLCKGSLLRLMQKPLKGGDTLWIDTAKAYDSLPEDLRSQVESLETLHFVRAIPTRPWGRPDMQIRMAEAAEGRTEGYQLNDLPEVVHPLVIRHPENGRKSLLLSPLSFTRILGMGRDEGDALFEKLVRHSIQPQFEYRHNWSVGDMVLWDNRRTLHFATGYPYADSRFLYRTTLGGAQPTGRYFTAQQNP